MKLVRLLVLLLVVVGGATIARRMLAQEAHAVDEVPLAGVPPLQEMP